tara:strand:+ start:125 stop:802 length:678 start_codon:yes stop_codon:yes gene_type:complete
MIIKIKEKQKYIKIYDLDMNFIGSFYTAREASRHVGAVHATIFSAMNRSIPLYNKYYIKTEGPSHIEYTKEIDAPIVIRNYTECRKCGVTLCEKNEFLTASPSCRKKGIKHRFSKCAHCTRKRNVCRVYYSNMELQELSVIQNVVIENKVYSYQNRSEINFNNNKRNLNYRNDLHDSYIIKCLQDAATVHKALGRALKKEEITPKLMDVKRKHILLTRKLRNQRI